ncbi:hypothetical protein Gogos_020339 [Gossypium gossypioides]|uniref:RNase H type-1 domain-containing protein n=1 Tax=Gossypium gossypioides TaxID=34282 RepID=A0A7J9D7U9_GOSGO|nr:hypothetical protein [Gossypium gossypioides]
MVPPVIPLISTNKKWMKQSIAYVKINIDAAISNGGVGFSVISRDSNGFVIRDVTALKTNSWMQTGQKWMLL